MIQSRNIKWVGYSSTHGNGYKYIRSFLGGGLKKLNEKNRV